MPVRVERITLWRAEVNHQPGALAKALQPLADARVNLQGVMGYRLPGDRARAAIEIFPVTGTKASSAAQTGGLSEGAISALHVEGDNGPGVGHAIAMALADAGINIDFFVGLVSGSRQTTVIGFENREDADRAIPLIKRAAAPPASATRKAAGKGTRATSRRGSRTAVRRRR